MKGLYFISIDPVIPPSPRAVESQVFFSSVAVGTNDALLMAVSARSPLTIVDGPFTAEVSPLYLFARSKFDGTARAEPLVQTGDSEGKGGRLLATVTWKRIRGA